MSLGIVLTAWSGQIKERAAAIHESPRIDLILRHPSCSAVWPDGTHA